MSRFWKEPQNVIAVGVTLISVCALIVSVTQTRIMIQQSELMDTQARASVRPILYFGRSRAFDPQTRQLIDFRMGVSNRGVGPALIDDVSIEYHEEFVHDWADLFSRMNLPDSVPDHATTSRIENLTLQAGQDIAILDLSDNLNLGRAIYMSLDSLKINILYSSIYGDQYELRRSKDNLTNEILKGEKKSYGKDSFEQ